MVIGLTRPTSQAHGMPRESNYQKKYVYLEEGAMEIAVLQRISPGGALLPEKNTKKKKVDREILSGCFLWAQKRAQSIQHVRITIVSAQEHHTTPSELRDRCI